MNNKRPSVRRPPASVLNFFVGVRDCPCPWRSNGEGSQYSLSVTRFLGDRVLLPRPARNSSHATASRPPNLRPGPVPWRAACPARCASTLMRHNRSYVTATGAQVVASSSLVSESCGSGCGSPARVVPKPTGGFAIKVARARRDGIRLVTAPRTALASGLEGSPRAKASQRFAEIVDRLERRIGHGALIVVS